MLSGACIAAAAAALVLAGVVSTTAQADDAKGRCFGANAFKGQGARGSAMRPMGGAQSAKTTLSAWDFCR